MSRYLYLCLHRHSHRYSSRWVWVYLWQRRSSNLISFSPQAHLSSWRIVLWSLRHRSRHFLRHPWAAKLLSESEVLPESWLAHCCRPSSLTFSSSWISGLRYKCQDGRVSRGSQRVCITSRGHRGHVCRRHVCGLFSRKLDLRGRVVPGVVLLPVFVVTKVSIFPHVGGGALMLGSKRYKTLIPTFLLLRDLLRVQVAR